MLSSGPLCGTLATDPTLLGDCGPVARFSFLLVTPSGQHRVLPDLGRSGWVGTLLFLSCSGNSRVCIGVRIESRKMRQPWRERRETKEDPAPMERERGLGRIHWGYLGGGHSFPH